MLCCCYALFCPNRVLELDPESADALLGLAMIAFGSTNVQEGLNSGLQYLQRAYAADASHPGVLCVLSHFSMVKSMYEEVRSAHCARIISCCLCWLHTRYVRCRAVSVSCKRMFDLMLCTMQAAVHCAQQLIAGRPHD